MDMENFTGQIVGIIIAVIVVLLVAVPVINDATSTLPDSAATLKTIVKVIPIFLVIAILLAVTGIFLKKKLFD